MEVKEKKYNGDYRLRPDDDFIGHAKLEELYVLTEHWLSDMEFYKEELRFFIHLVDRYFILLLKEEHINKAQIIVSNIRALERSSERITLQMKEHIKDIEEFYEYTEGYDDAQFRTDHADLEQEFVDFVQSITELKQDVFAISRRMIEIEKLTHLLTA